MNYHKKTYRSFGLLLRTVLTYSIGAFYFGYSMGYFNSFDFKEVHHIFKIQMQAQKAEGIFSGCLPFGALFGAYFSRFIIDKFSRRKSCLIIDVIAIFAGLLVLFPNSTMLVIGRFMQGFCVGLFSSLVPIMIKQYTPMQLSGSFGALLAPSIGCGFFVAYLSAYLLTSKYQIAQVWRLIYGFPLTMLVLQFFLIWKVYTNQTPKYLISKGRISQAKTLIQQIYKHEFVEIILNQKIADIKVQQNQNNYQLTNSMQKQKQGPQELVNQEKPTNVIQPENGNQQVQIDLEKEKDNKDMQQQKLAKQSNKSQVYPKDIPLARLFAVLLQAFHQLSGVNIIVIYGAHLAEQALPQLKNQMPMIINGEKIIAGLLGTLLLKKYGRRYLMLRGVIIITVALLGLFIGFSLQRPDSQITQILIIVCLILFINSFVITLGPITWLYIPEIVQPPTVPYITIVNWVLACAIITIYPMIKSYTNQVFLFLFFISVLNFFMCYFYMVETKGKNQNQIRKQFFVNETHLRSLWKEKEQRQNQQKQSQI